MSTTDNAGAASAPATAPAAAPASAAAAPAAAPAASTQATAAATGATTQTTTTGEPQNAAATGEGGQGKQGTDSQTTEAVYEYQMPEGIELDQTAADSLTAIAKEKGLSPADAQKFADIGVQMVQRQAEAHAQIVAAWVDQVKADPELGGDKFDQSIVVAQEAMARFGSQELKDVMRSSGLGNHPAVVRFFHKVGTLVSQDSHVGGRSTPAGLSNEDAALAKMYPTMAPKA
jgi:hypothetical protein